MTALFCIFQRCLFLRSYYRFKTLLWLYANDFKCDKQVETHIMSIFKTASIILWAGFVASCAQYNIPQDISGPAYIEVSPYTVISGSGQVHTIWVTVLDGERNPLHNVPVKAKSDTPNRISVTPESLYTNEEGKAVFTVNAISYVPGTAQIVFTANGLTAKVETDFIYQ